MADLITVKLLRPLNGKEIGETADYSKVDAERLEKRGVVKIVGAAKAEEPVANKAAPAPANKAAPKRKGK